MVDTVHVKEQTMELLAKGAEMRIVASMASMLEEPTRENEVTILTSSCVLMAP